MHALDRDQALLAMTRAALGGDGLMPNTTTTPPWPSPRRGHPGLRRVSVTGRAANAVSAVVSVSTPGVLQASSRAGCMPAAKPTA